jgi:hypothetical protein
MTSEVGVESLLDIIFARLVLSTSTVLTGQAKSKLADRKGLLTQERRRGSVDIKNVPTRLLDFTTKFLMSR